MTSPQNPRFTKVVVNRLWKKIFGRGLVEPLTIGERTQKPPYPNFLSIYPNY